MYYAIGLENVFNGKETYIFAETDNIDAYMDCNSDLQFQEVLDIEEISEEEYNEEVG